MRRPRPPEGIRELIQWFTCSTGTPTIDYINIVICPEITFGEMFPSNDKTDVA